MEERREEKDGDRHHAAREEQIDSGEETVIVDDMFKTGHFVGCVPRHPILAPSTV